MASGTKFFVTTVNDRKSLIFHTKISILVAVGVPDPPEQINLAAYQWNEILQIFCWNLVKDDTSDDIVSDVQDYYCSYLENENTLVI